MDLLNELAPTDIDPAMLAQVRALFDQQQAELARQDAVLAEKDFKITALTHELAYYRRVRFGDASEALVGEQRMLFDETVDMDLAAIEEELEGQAPAKRQRIEHRHEPGSCQCGRCGADLVKIGEDISEQLDVEPARFFVHRHIRPQYACHPCETVTAAPIPPAVIDGGLAAVGLLAWIAACKYLDHLPLYRIEQIAARQGVPPARSTLGEWIGRIGVALQPLADRLAELLRERSCLHADETPVRQLTPAVEKLSMPTCGHTVRTHSTTGRQWSCSTTRPAVLAHARAFLQDWRGHLMVDDHVGYKALLTAGPIELACLDHIRRKFFDVHAASGSPMAEEALRRIAQLYAIEQQASGMTSAQRLALREQHAIPALAALHTPALPIEARLTLAVDIALVGINVAAGVGGIDHLFKVQRVVFAGGADLANDLVALVGVGRELVAEVGLAVLLGPARLDILLAPFGRRPISRHRVLGHDGFLFFVDRLFGRLRDAGWPPRAI
jgi:transposase